MAMEVRRNKQQSGLFHSKYECAIYKYRAIPLTGEQERIKTAAPAPSLSATTFSIMWRP